jgi:hypothetical protein
MLGAAGVLVVLVAMPLQPRTKSAAFVVVTLHVHATPVLWVLLAVASRALPGARPVKDAAAMRPCVTEPEKVAVITVPAASPTGAVAETIAP